MVTQHTVRAMKSTVYAFFLLSVLAAGAVSVWAFGMRGSPLPRVLAQDSLADQEQVRLDQQRNAAWRANLISIYGVHGVALNSAEFHLLRPHTDERLREMMTNDSPLDSDWFSWWPVAPRYELSYHYGPAMPMLPSDVHVGLGELFSKRVLSDAIAWPDGQGAFRVEVTFSQQGVAYLTQLLASRPGFSNLDWFGAVPLQGQPTVMEAVVVANNLAYKPFSVTNVVSQQLWGVPIVVADDLSQSEADFLAAALAP